VPGLRADYEEARRRMQANEEVVEFTDDAALRAALEALPCCVTNKDGSKNGDPLNLVIIGDANDAFPALARRGWSATEVTWSGSVMRMIKSVLAGERYPYSPVSNLYLYGRPQDLAVQKARDTIHQRNHLRLWRSPMRYHGKPVWVGQISRDIGSRLTIHSPTFTTHKIDPDVDEAARALVEDLAYSQNLQAYARVAGVGAAPKSAPRENLTTDPYYTSGYRFVLLFDSTPTSLTDIRILPLETGEGLIDRTTSGDAP
jgi:LssY C-terminus